MKWYHYLFGFLAGMFLANVIPHYTHGIAGDWFPTPFATPPGKGLSSPQVNMAWALANLVVGTLFLRYSRVSWAQPWTLLPLFLGFVALSFMCSVAFQKKHPVSGTGQPVAVSELLCRLVAA